MDGLDFAQTKVNSDSVHRGRGPIGAVFELGVTVDRTHCRDIMHATRVERMEGITSTSIKATHALCMVLLHGVSTRRSGRNIPPKQLFWRKRISLAFWRSRIRFARGRSGTFAHIVRWCIQAHFCPSFGTTWEFRFRSKPIGHSMARGSILNGTRVDSRRLGANTCQQTPR